MTHAVNPFGPDAEPPRGPDWAKRRERAVWYAVVGIGLMFAGQINTAFAIGGAFMVLFGIFEYIRWSLKRPKDEDPWRDPELDAWEARHYADDRDDLDAPDIIDEEPEEALGLHDRF